MTLSRSEIRQLLDARGLAPQRVFGQNFVADPNTVRRIAHLASLSPNDRVIEIGAGLGSLTLALAETGAQVTAIEIDDGLVEVLRDVVATTEPPVRVVHADATRVDWDALLGGVDRWTLVANLPYNVATPLVCDLLDEVPAIGSMLVMVQREVAERFAASPGDAGYGAVSVKAAFWADARIVGYVPASVFVPRPQVESALVRLDRRQPPDAAPDTVFGLVRAAFTHRRKMLRRTLGDMVPKTAFEETGIDPTRRPETLGLDAWCALANALDRRHAPALDERDS